MNLIKYSLIPLLALTACAKEPEVTAATSSSAEAESHAYTTLTDDSFDSFVASSDVTVVDFWAPWCGPCRTMGPRFEQSATTLAGKAKYGKLNIDDNPQMTSKFKIKYIPAIVILKNGEPVQTIVGVKSEEELTETVKSYL